MKRFKIQSLLTFLITVVTAFSTYGQDAGQQLFEAKCSICHTIGGGKLVGPDLDGVTSKYEIGWLRQFIMSSQTVIKSGDSAAVAVFKEYKETVMPDQVLTDAELNSVIGYLAGPGGAPIARLELPEGHAGNGEKLFMGLVRFEERGASCNSCHNVNYGRYMSGGALAKDLTASHANLGGAGISAILSKPPFPAMTKAYDNDTLTLQEIADLTAFLGEVSAEAPNAPVQVNDGNKLLYGGSVAVTFLLVSFSLFWIRRKRYPVNKRIYDRQMGSKP
jgi:mono/diheme cytochrome c family protein